MKQMRIRDLRENRNLTQKELAGYLRIHQTTYSDYELGRLNVPVSILHMLADFYDVSVDYLLGRTNVKAPYPKTPDL
ncbi:MAG: helix-turn-helix transcriptional regulator [Oscillospiraceae bacterium]|jgi:transcriptional regulator with XRE-family HTH domain|nr:helix-turn-helix transcriptional regulator [Oscillospiraceae bacterium]